METGRCPLVNTPLRSGDFQGIKVFRSNRQETPLFAKSIERHALWFRQHGSGFAAQETGIHQLIVMGLIAHTCVEATVRYAAELGYEVTTVKDATADYSDEEMHAALDVNIPNYANAIVTTNEVVEALSFHLRLTQSGSNA
jgi:hypothetical protein